MPPSNTTTTAAGKKPSTVGSQNPSASNVSAEEWKALKDRLAIGTAGTRYSGAADDDDDDDDDTMTVEQAAAAKASAQKSTKRIPSGPSVPSRKT